VYRNPPVRSSLTYATHEQTSCRWGKGEREYSEPCGWFASPPFEEAAEESKKCPLDLGVENIVDGATSELEDAVYSLKNKQNFRPLLKISIFREGK